MMSEKRAQQYKLLKSQGLDMKQLLTNPRYTPMLENVLEKSGILPNLPVIQKPAALEDKSHSIERHRTQDSTPTVPDRAPQHKRMHTLVDSQYE